MTSKPTRIAKSRYKSPPYLITWLLVWGATILSYTPPWFYRPLLYVINHSIRIVLKVKI